MKCGDEIELICDGIDEQAAMEALTSAISMVLVNKGVMRIRRRSCEETSCGSLLSLSMCMATAAEATVASAADFSAEITAAEDNDESVADEAADSQDVEDSTVNN